jgi:hypothetical protein
VYVGGGGDLRACMAACVHVNVRACLSAGLFFACYSVKCGYTGSWGRLMDQEKVFCADVYVQVGLTGSDRAPCLPQDLREAYLEDYGGRGQLRDVRAAAFDRRLQEVAQRAMLSD